MNEHKFEHIKPDLLKQLRLSSAQNVQDRLAGTAILSALVDIDTLETKQKFRIVKQIGALLKSSDMEVCAEAAALYGKVIAKHWPEATNSAEKDVGMCLEWLSNERNDVRRMTALLLLKALCTDTSTSLYSYISKILTSLSLPLRDRRLDMRLAAAKALGACLRLVQKQDQAPRLSLLNYVFEDLQRDQQMGTTEGYHAMLLRYPELVKSGGMFMQAHFGHASELALKLKDHPDAVVRKAAIELLPVLAQYSPTTSQSMRSAASAHQRTRPRTAFLALADIAKCCSTEFRPYLEPTMRAIRDTLAHRAKSRSVPAQTDETAAAVLKTISTLATAMGPALTRYMRDILDLMFTTGLSQELCGSLKILVCEVGQLRQAIHDRLLDMVSIILAGVPFRPMQPCLDSLESRMGSVSLHYASSTVASGLSSASLGDRSGSLSGSSVFSSEQTSLVVAAASNIPVTTEVIVLALRTLSEFDFSNENLSEFVRNKVLDYLNDASSDVRKQAIYAASHIIRSDPLYKAMAGAGVEVAGDVMQRLIMSAVTDPSAEVRLMAVEELKEGSCFDFHLGKAQNIQSLFLLLNDEVFNVRLAVLAVLGRLANMNPAHVMPPLRRMVVQLLTELEFSRSSREREDCIRLLIELVGTAENWVRPYVGDIFRTILPRINDGASQLASKLLDMVAALARVGGNDLVPHLDTLLVSIMQDLADQTSVQKRMSALKAISSCASFCGMVIYPYTEYPQLFGMLREVNRVLGALGAIDPHVFKNAKNKAAGRAGNSSSAAGPAGILAAMALLHKAKQGGPAPNVMTVFNSEKPREILVGDIHQRSELFTSVSVNALLRILNSPADAKDHLLAVQELNTMFASLQKVCGQYLESVVPAILRAMAAAPPDSANSYIERLSRLVGIARQLIRPYLEPLFALFDADAIISEQQQKVLIGLIEVLAESLSGDFGPHIAKVLPFLIAVIDRDIPSLEGYLYLIMPQLIALLELAMTPLGVVEQALECMATIVAAVNCNSFASRIVLKLVQLLRSAPTPTLQTAVIDTMCVLMEQLQGDFASMKARGVADHAKYKRYSRLLFLGQLIPRDPQRVQSLMQGTCRRSMRPRAGRDSAPKLFVDVVQLRRAWSTTQRLSKGDWITWLNNFAVELLRQSPSPALRACTKVALSQPRLSSELFNAAFVSCWTELPGQYQQEVISSLQEVASHSDVPSEILQTILSLAGYMERDEKQIPIDLKLLGEYADRCHALAKELHYKEAEWTLENGYGTIEKLIELNQDLDLHDSAVGMLNYVRKEQPDIEDCVEWHLRLQRWDEALAIYRQEESELGPSYVNTNGQIRCLFEMSDWESLAPIYDTIWSGTDQQMQMASANIGMSMAWAMGDIERMEQYLAVLPNKSRDKSFCRALLAVYRNQFEEAETRGYAQVFRCQMLTELEEVIAYKTVHDDNERRMAIVNTWRRRLEGIQQDVGLWQKLLRLRSMVLRPILDLDTWIKYANMCRKSGQMKIARHAISQLLTDEAQYMEEVNRGEVDVMSGKLVMQAQEFSRLKAQSAQQPQPQSRRGSIVAGAWDSRGRRFSVTSGGGGQPDTMYLDSAIRLSQQPALVYMYLKYKWAAKERREAFQMLEMFAGDYSAKIGFDLRNPDAFADSLDARALENVNSGHLDLEDEVRTNHLLARFYFKRAEWLSSIQASATLAQEARSKAGLNGPGVVAGGGDIGNTANSSGPNLQQQLLLQQRRGSRHGSANMGRSRVSISFSATGAPVLDSAFGRGADVYEDENAEAQAAKDAEFLYRLKGDRINDSIIESYRAATVLDSKWYKAWHLLALRHFHETQQYDMEHGTVPEDVIAQHVVPAVHGFFRAIQLSKSNTTLQDTLRLLTAWFNYSQHESVAQAVQDGFNTVSLRTWLQVIPQILARIHNQFESTSKLIKQLLVEVGKFHPNAIMFSLYVAARGTHPKRSQAAKDVLAKLHDLAPELVEETEIVSRELIRITLLFPEMWHDALDNASKYYFKQHDPEEMMRILKPLHERARNPETLREYHFVQMFGTELATQSSTCPNTLAPQAWESYYVIFRRINKLYPEPKILTLKDTAPTLLQCRDMHLAVPGTYDPDRELVRIDSFDPVVTDERVMQLFGLINSLLTRDIETAQRSLAIERFPVIPLSSNSGLIGFYPNCENIHGIIQSYREAHHLFVNLEQRMAQQFAPNLETLTIIQKVEAFEYALLHTPGNDLQRAMWYKSPNAEVWLERRTNYTRSLAVMSIAGYILGLGDRHPSNIMMHTWTGNIVHIDFGDCFELAAHREKYPETIPFRLTRMFIMPMEVSTIEGLFKFTANHTMRVLRANRDSLMAVLEAFVFDPLVSWSYLQDDESAQNQANADKATTAKQQRSSRGTTGMDSQMSKWDEVTNTKAVPDETNMMAGSPSDGRVAKSLHFKNHGIDDRGWQTGNPKALVGTDFDPNKQLDVAEQIEKLIQQATSSENLAVLYVGWVPLW
ncbi:armadillo-type protein [Kickxella alabastrina]|uniref:armadillo-type protein n=1 Tax=Kickxella alabastrina TaxID=61397 RepID=UPI00221F8BE9|nr:armadillo-type protein [Kickxella alabastrina]KAI7830142.1 armadillo-type protein [Kickxella alabastrina]